MYLTNLADIARRAGLRVVEQPGWRTRGHGGQSDVRAVICHHTAGGAGNAASLGVVETGRSDLPGPLSHFLLAKDGTAYVVAAGLCYHAGAVLNTSWGNAYTIGIEAERSLADINAHVPWPEVQMAAYARLCRALSDAFGAQVLGHKEICAPTGRKIDPDFDMSAFRRRVAGTDQEDDMQLTDKFKTFNGTEITVAQAFNGILTRLADPVIESARYPGHTDTLANFVKAIDGNVLNVADGLKNIADAQAETNRQLAKLVTLLTPKETL